MATTYASPLDVTTTATEPLANDLSQGIPTESAPNPLMEELQRPAMEREEDEQKQQAEFIRDRAKTLQKNLIDPSTIEYDFSRTSDPESAKKQALAMAYVRLQNGGQPIPGGKVGYQITRDRIAKAKFNGAGAGDDKAFFDQIQAEAVKNKERFELAQKVQEEAVTNTFREVFDPIRSRQDVKPWKDQLAELKKSPGYEPGNEFRYLEIANAVRADIIDSTKPHREKYLKIWTAISSDDDNAAYAAARESYEAFQTPEDRKQFLTTLQTIAATLPEERQATFWNNFTRQTSRDFIDMGRNIARMEASGDDLTTLGDFIEYPGSKTGRQLQAEFLRDQPKREAMKNFAEDVQQIRRQDFAKVKRQWGTGIMGDIEAGIYAMPGAVGTTLVAALPYVGQVATFKMMEGGAYSDMRQQLMSQGVDEEKASSTAKGIAPVISAIQYIPERFGAKAVTRRIPWLEKIHTGISNKITNRLMRGVVTGATVGAIELGTEVFQDQVPNVMQDVVAELDATIPGTDWEQEMDGFWSQTLTTAVAILPLAMMGAAGGVNQEARVRAFAEMPSRVRLAYGITPEADAAIEAAKQQGPESLNQAVEAAQLTRDPKSESAMDAVQEIAEEMNAAQEAMKELEKSTLFPLVNYDTETKVYTLIDKNTNELIGEANTAEKAVRLAAAWNESIELDESDYLTYLVTTLEGAAESATLDADQTYPELNQRKTSYTFDLARTYTATEAAQESQENASRVASQLALKETAATGNSEMTQVVFGQSVTDPQSLSRKFRETTNRLYRGASVLTVFHEETHGFWREAIATGRLKKSEAVDLFKALDTLAAKQNLKSGQEARYLKEDFDSMSEAEQETAIDEAIAELMEAEILRTRKGGGVRTVSKGLVSRNLAAIARLTGDKTAGKFKAFIDAIRAFFGITMDRALVLKRGIKDGSIDKDAYESFLNRLYGLTEQADFERFQQEAEKGIMDEIEFDEEAAILEDFPDGNPFSIGRATITPTAETQSLQTTDGKTLTGPASFSIGAWHGTPHKVDKFTTEKIGTGEGAQAFGWGLYFAEAMATAHSYRSALSHTTINTYKGKEALPISELSKKKISEFSDEELIASAIEWGADLDRKSPGDRAETMVNWGNLYEGGNEKNTITRLKNLGENYDSKKYESFRGRLYQVNLKVEEDHLLDWDKTLAEQSEFVKAAIQKLKGNHAEKTAWFRSQERGTGGYLYSAIASQWNTEIDKGESASKDFAAAGIRGIRYLDGDSRLNYHVIDNEGIVRLRTSSKDEAIGEAALGLLTKNGGKEWKIEEQKGSYNYVIFDENDIEILSENGQPVDTAAAGSFSIGKKMSGSAFEGGTAQDFARLRLRNSVSIRSAEAEIDPRVRLPISQLLSFQSAPSKEGDVSPRGNGEETTSFSIGRAREKWGDAMFDLTQAHKTLADIEKSAIKDFYEWKKTHGYTIHIQDITGYIAGEIIYRYQGYALSQFLGQLRRGIIPENVDYFATNEENTGGGIFSIATRLQENGKTIVELMGYDHAPFPEPKELIAAREKMFEAEASVYLAEEDFDPDSIAREEDMNSARLWKLSQQARTFAALLDARDIEAKNAAKSFVTRIWETFAKHDEIFQFARSNSKDVAEIAETVSTPGNLITVNDNGDSIRINGKNGFITIMDADTSRPYITASSAGSKGKKSGGGTALYVVALDWMHNNGKVIKDDPAGLTDINTIRRTSNMVASSIRWGTTAHLKPNSKQAVGKWTKNDTLNTSLLITKEMENTHEILPESKSLRYDFAQDSFLRDGSPITEAELEDLIEDTKSFDKGIGISTLQRSIITASAIDEFQRGTSETLIQSLESDLAPSLKGVSYSLGQARQIDQQYLAAVEAGDMTTAQSMVDEAAKAAGYTIKAYHGGTAEDVFDPEKLQDSEGFFFSSNEEVAAGYRPPIGYDMPKIKEAISTASDKQIEELAKLSNSWADTRKEQEQDIIESLGNIDSDGDPEMFATLNSYMRILGKKGSDFARLGGNLITAYLKIENPTILSRETSRGEIKTEIEPINSDGIIRRGFMDAKGSGSFGDGIISTIYSVKNPTQIKSAEAVTRDESGNIIPLSQRFNPADERISYSIGQSRLADLLAEDAYRRIKNPEVRAKALSKISRELARLRTEAEKLEVTMGSKRLTKSLRRETAMRQAMRFEELENQALARHQGVLSDDEIAILTSYPIHGALIREEKQSYKDKEGRTRTRVVKKGRLMSRTQAASRHPDMFTRDNAGEYDGSDGMSPVIYGGNNMPDTVAQDLYDQGLLSDPTPDALWQALRAEQNTVGKMKEALEAAKADLRAARATSITEARDWLASQVNIQENTYSQKEEILRASALLDAILAALPAQLRGQIGGYTPLARLGSNDSRLSFLRDRLDRADRLLEKYLRKQFDREFRLLLDRARPEKDEAGKRPKGKLGSTVHELFDDIRDAMNLDATEVEALVASLDVLATNPDNSPEQQAHAMLASNLVSLAGNWRNADAARMEIALKEAQAVYNKGYGEAMVEAKRKAERRQDARHTFQTATASDGHRMDRVRKAAKENTRRNLPKQFLQSLYSFEQVAQLAFGKNLKELKSLLEWERRASNAKHDAITNKTQKLEQLFADLAGGKFKGEKLRWEMSQPGTIKATDGLGVEQTFSVLEAITATMLWRQEDGRRHMEGHKNENGQVTGSWNWTDAAMDQIENQLDGNARMVRMHLSEEYAAEYERLNAIYKSLYGVSLPQHKFYSPITVKPVQAQAGQTIDPVTGALTSGNMMSPGSLKTRSQSAIAEPDFRDALHTYIAHTMQMEHWMAYAPFAIEAQAIFGNRELRNSIEASAGKETLNILSSWLDYFAQGGTRDAAAHLGLTQSMNRALGRAASVALVGRISVLVIQSTQLLAGAHAMPMGAFTMRLAKLLTGQLDWKAALKSDYIRRRLEQMPPVVRQSMEALAYAKPSKLKYLAQKMGQTISGADALFTGGTYAIAYDYHFTQAKKDGASDAQAEVIAHREAEISTDRVAQPTKAATRSLLEVTSTNPFMRLAWSFASEPRQKLALSAFAFSSETNVGEKARALFVTWIAGGVVSSLIRAAIADLRHDEDDEWFDERNWDAKRLALQTLTGPLAGIPIIGDSVEAAAFKLAGVFMPEGNLFSMGQKGLESATKVPQWFTGEREFMDAIADAEKMVSGVGIFSGNAAAAASLSHVVVDAFKVIDNLIDED